MKPVRLLFLLLGVICLLPKKTLCMPLYEQDLLKADDLDDDWFSEYANGRSYREDGKDEKKEENKQKNVEVEDDEVDEDEEEGEDETEADEAATEPKKEDSASGDNKASDKAEQKKGGSDSGNNKASETGKVESKKDDQKKPEGSTGSTTRPKEAGASIENSKPKGDKLNADVANGKGSGEKNNMEGDAEEEEDEDEDEDEEDEDGEDEDDEDEDDDEDDEGAEESEDNNEDDIQERDKSERSNVAAGRATVSYTKATAHGVEVSESGITEEPAHFPNHIPEDAKRLMQNYQTWAAGRTGAAAASSEPRNPLLAQSSGRPGTSTGTSAGTSAGAGGRPIILPIVFVPFDMRTNRVNMPAQMQSHPSGRQGQGFGPPPSGRPQQVYGQPPIGYDQSPQGLGRPPPSYGRPSPGQPLPQHQEDPNPRDLQLLVVPIER